MKKSHFRAFALLAGVVLLTLPISAAEKKDRVPVQLYVMSMCPFGVQAEDGIFPAVKSLAKYVDFDLHFIANAVPGANGLPLFTSLHGEPEVQEDIRQVCAIKLSPDKYMDYILERNKSVRNPDWKAAAVAARLPSALIAKIEDCAKGPQGAALLSKSIESSQARSANSSPTIDIAGTPHTRGRSQAAFTVAVCDALQARGTALPKDCAEARLAAANDPAGLDAGCGAPGAPSAGTPPAAAAPVAFDIKVVTEKDCEICKPTLLDEMATLHPGAKVQTIDANSKEGQELIRRHGAKSLPLYVLDSKVEQDSNFSRLLPVAYYKSGDGYLIRHGPTNYFPSVQLGRKRLPRHLDVFFQSLSPASAQAERDLIQFMVAEEKSLGDLTFSLHFVTQEEIVSDKAKTPEAPTGAVRTASLSEIGSGRGELSSPRGEAEIAEDIRQLCVFQHKPIGEFFNYLSCRNQNLADLQQGPRCLKPDAEVKLCIEGGEGQKLLRQDARLAAELELSRAPTFLWENRYGPNGFNDVDWRNLLRNTGKRK